LIEKRTLELCRAYAWPANVRELQNIIERSVILCAGERLSIDDAWLSPGDEDSGPLTKIPVGQEKEMIEAALAERRGKVPGPQGAAAKLGIPPSTRRGSSSSRSTSATPFPDSRHSPPSDGLGDAHQRAPAPAAHRSAHRQQAEMPG